jgi:uroporphyrinogen decarboxylase
VPPIMVTKMTDRKTKIERILAALNHQEADRVPMGEFFWTNFVERTKRELGLGDALNLYRHWDLDFVVITPNMDPHIRGIQVLEDSPDRKVVRTGFEATIERRSSYPMPRFLQFATQSYADMEAFVFDDPADPRRYYAAIDDQLNSVADALNLNLPSFVDRVNAYADDFCVFGSVGEPHEMIWRILGPENVLIKIAEEPGKVARFVERLGDFLVGIVKAQVAAVGEKLTGLYIWGDIAYCNGMMFSPAYWRKVYKPQLKRICDEVHAAGLKAIYHSDGDASAVYDDLIEVGVDGYNPLEAKAGLDVVELKRKYGRRWAFNGNIDVMTLESNDRNQVRREVLRKLNAAKGGGYILQSDHSVPGSVDPATYDYMVQLVRDYGRYPLRLGECDEPI